MDSASPGSNRGYGFLTFYNHAAADAARRKLDGSLMWGGGGGWVGRGPVQVARCWVHTWACTHACGAHVCTQHLAASGI